MKQIDSQARPLFIIGFMGTGKSLIGSEVAHMLEIPFIDLDQAIETEVGQSVAGIFKTLGEQRFRQLEHQFVEHLDPNQHAVIACGGGLPIAPGMLDLLNHKGHTVALFANVQTVFKRTTHLTHRPLLQGSDADKLQTIKHLLEEREPLYQKAHMAIRTDEPSVGEVTIRIVRWYQQR